MDTLILAAHVVVCVFLVILVLLQSGKEGMGVIFGGGSSSLFGSSGAGGVLAKLTMFAAIAFVITSLGYNIATTERKPVESVIPSVQFEDAAKPAAPIQPAPAQAAPSQPAPIQSAPAQEVPTPAPAQSVPAPAPAQSAPTPAAPAQEVPTPAPAAPAQESQKQ